MTLTPITKVQELFEDSHNVGRVVRMSYTDATISTNDRNINQAGGIPRNSFLLAVAGDFDSNGQLVAREEEVVLLAVQGVANLQSTRENAALIEDLASKDISPNDIHTKMRLSLMGFECRIVGTFYYSENEGQVVFGADLDRVLAYSSYIVVKPYGESLSKIASYGRPKGNSQATQRVVELGRVRYSETEKVIDRDAKVYIDVKDFVGKKSAVFGMTRSGKALTEDTKIPVPPSSRFPTGWALNRDLELGDSLYSSRGTPVKISNFTEWRNDEVFELEFSDGQVVKTSGNHLWLMNDLDSVEKGDVTLDTAKAQHIEVIAENFADSTYLPALAIAKLADIDAGELLEVSGASGISRHLAVSDDRYDALLYPVSELLLAYSRRLSDKSLPEGRRRPLKRVMTSRELFNLQREKAGRWAVDLVRPDHLEEDHNLEHPPYAIGLCVNPNAKNANSIIQSLREVDEIRPSLDGDSIPKAYLRASYSQRLDLLQGIMDANGGVKTSGDVFAYFENEKLATDCLELVRSMGMKVSLKSRNFDSRARRLYILTFTPSDEVFRLDHLLRFQKTSESSFNVLKEVRKNGRANVRCITVESADALHLVEGFIPTHNSNTIKVLTQQVFEYSKLIKEPVGQLIFDPQGEYANPNTQDGGSRAAALSDMGSGNDVIIYRTKRKGGAREKLLLINFLDRKNVELFWKLFTEELSSGMSSGANYISGISSVEMTAPLKSDEMDAQTWIRVKTHYNRCLLGIYSFMHEAKIRGSIKPIYLNVGKDDVDSAIRLDDEGGIRHAKLEDKNSGEICVTTTKAAFELFTWISKQGLSLKQPDKDEAIPWSLSRSWRSDVEGGDFGEFVNQWIEYHIKGRNGFISAFKRLKELHTSEDTNDMREEIWDDLLAGRLIMIDLSLGSPAITTRLSELIVNSIISKASDRFTSGEKAAKIQLIVEEAHNLFRRDGAKNDNDPWVKLSKEGAKYEIGLIYATQEVSSVDPRILSNTSNFVIANLSSSKETKELEAYYTFADWSSHIRNCESRGFVRLKTESSPFIIPVQINKFEVGRE